MVVNEERYSKIIRKILDLCYEAREDNILYEIKEVARIIEEPVEDVKDTIKQFADKETKKAMYKPTEVNPDFFLIGDTIAEINKLKMYKLFRKTKMAIAQTAYKMRNPF